jgi:hypothetical protein
MCTTLLAARDWALMEFSAAQLGDSRRTKRLIQVAAALAQTQSGTLPSVLPEWAELKGAYRLFDTKDVTHQRILHSHQQQTRAQCSQPGEYLLIEDTTVLDFNSHRATQGLGPISTELLSQGMLLHTTLALRVESWDAGQHPVVTIKGLLDQQCWVRPEQRRKTGKSRSKILRRRRESERWARCFVGCELPAHSQWIFIADREADIYECFERCNEAGLDFVIRAAQPRVLEEEITTVFAAAKQAPVLGSFDVELRTRGDSPKRIARVDVKSAAVTLRGPWRPGGRLAPFEVNVVLVEEIGGPAGEAIHWLLLTSLPCQSFAEARRIVARYTRRWMIEEYHKALKTGAQIESSQLESAHRLQALLGVLALVALRLLNTKLVARAMPDLPVDENAFGPEAIAVLNAKFGKPEGRWTHATLLVAIARLGGFLARRSDGTPGWITIWRGWRKLQAMAEGVQLISTCG